MTAQWDNRWSKILVVMAEWSEDRSSKYAALIVDNKHRLLGSGFNGIPRGVPSDPAYHQRPDKYNYFVHAEANAILNARVPVDGSCMYVISPPCGPCAGLIVQSGISLLKYLRPHNTNDPKWTEQTTGWRDSVADGVDILAAAQIHVQRIGDDN